MIVGSDGECDTYYIIGEKRFSNLNQKHSYILLETILMIYFFMENMMPETSSVMQ